MSAIEYLRSAEQMDPDLVELAEIELGKLNLRFHEILLMRNAGFSNSEIADFLKCNLRTVLRSLRRIKCYIRIADRFCL